MNKIKHIRLTAFVFAILMIFSLAFSASAAGVNDKISLTLICRNGNNILTGMNWRIYYVGKRVGNELVLDGSFKDYPVSLESALTDSSGTAANTLENYAIVDRVAPLSSGQIDENGYLVFPELENGLYMVSGDIFNVNEVFYQPMVSLVEIDSSVDESNVEMVVYPKIKYALLSDIDLNNIVKKIWKDNKTFHEDLQVEIYKNAELFKTVTLSEENQWTYKWKANEAASWRVKEVEVPKDYSVVYESSNGKHVIENTFNGIGEIIETKPAPTTAPLPPEPKLPQTGQLWWPVVLMGCSGVILIIVGIKIKNIRSKL